MCLHAVALVNPRSPRAGVHLVDHTVFAACGLMMASYRRNTFDGQGQANGVKTCLKVIAVPRHGQNQYGSFVKKDERVDMEIELVHAQKIGAVLYGRLDSHVVEIIRRGKPKKTLSIRKQSNVNVPIVISLEVGDLHLTTGITGTDAWNFLMVLMRLLKTLQPGLEDRMLLETFLRLA